MIKKITGNRINSVPMKNMFRFLLLSLGFFLFFELTYAEKNPVSGKKDDEVIKQTAAGCAAGSNYKYLDINNVRTLCYSYGNGWFLEIAEYEIPKGSGKTSMFSFSLWIGGIDLNNNLKLAVMDKDLQTGMLIQRMTSIPAL
jgi:hypothetical protein